MFQFLTVIFCFVSFSSAGLQQTVILSHENEHSGKYSSGAELTSLAHSSAIQAKTAVQNQQTAGSQAAFGATSSLAQAALGAAATAQAAAVGKQAIVQSLKKQVLEAEHQFEAELGQLHQTQQAASAAQEAAGQSQITLNSITAALASAQGGAQHATAAASEASNVNAAQEQMVVEAKQRLHHLKEQLQQALGQLLLTQASAQKALEAAAIAQDNAATAGAAVALAAQDSQNNHEESKGW